MSYTPIDPQIRAWAEKNKLKLATSWVGGETRAIYVSSEAGECFQIWIDPVVANRTSVYADCVEGRKENDGPTEWSISANDIAKTLDEVFDAVVCWMKPSERYFFRAH